MLSCQQVFNPLVLDILKNGLIMAAKEVVTGSSAIYTWGHETQVYAYKML